MATSHILVLGASGNCGIAFIDQVIAMGKPEPFLTLYVRPGNRTKMPSTVNQHSNFRTIEGDLTDHAAMVRSLSASGSPPPSVTTVVSFLGTDMSLQYLITRQTPTPIADALQSVVLPTMKQVGVKRIFVLTTINGFRYPKEVQNTGMMLRCMMYFPKIMAPQAEAEMRGVATKVLRAAGTDLELEWTLYRVPMLNDEAPDLKVAAGELSDDFEGTLKLSRGTLARWILNEIAERQYVRKAVLLGNMAA